MRTQASSTASRKVRSAVPLAELVVDPAYQRELDERRVSRIVDGFDPALLGTLEVSTRHGNCAVFDGHHRLATLMRLRGDNVAYVVHSGLSVADEARLFVQLQTERKALPPLDRWRARLVAGEEQASAIDRIVKAAGYEVTGSTGASAIGAVTALDRTFELDKTGELLAQALDLLTVWKGEPKATDGALIQGLGLFVSDHGRHPKVQSGDVIAAFEEVPARMILRRAIAQTTNGGGSATRPVAVLRELRRTAGVRGRPQKWKPAALHSEKGREYDEGNGQV